MSAASGKKKITKKKLSRIAMTFGGLSPSRGPEAPDAHHLMLTRAAVPRAVCRTRALASLATHLCYTLRGNASNLALDLIPICAVGRGPVVSLRLMGR